MSGLAAVMADLARGGAPDTILLMRLLSEAATETEARDALGAAAAIGESTAPAAARLQALWAAHPGAWHLVRSVLAGVQHAPREGDAAANVRRWAETFDRLAGAAPEASVALYSLNSPDLLAQATAEIVAIMGGFGLLDPRHDALDLGCGIGRLTLALAPHLRSVLGVDIAAGMLAEARRRCAGVATITLQQGSGHDLAGIGDASLDIVLAADVFPYLVQVGEGLPGRHVEEFARVLRPGGAALIFNYSYRGDLPADAREVGRLAGAAGLEVERSGTRDLTLWDAATFLLRKPL